MAKSHDHGTACVQTPVHGTPAGCVSDLPLASAKPATTERVRALLSHAAGCNRFRLTSGCEWGE